MAEKLIGRFLFHERVRLVTDRSSRGVTIDQVLDKITALAEVIRRRKRARAEDRRVEPSARSAANEREHQQLRDYAKFLREFYAKRGGRP